MSFIKEKAIYFVILTLLVYFLCFYDSLLSESTQLISSYKSNNHFLINNVL